MAKKKVTVHHQDTKTPSVTATEQKSALVTEEYLEERAKRGSRAKYEAVLAKVPDVEPEAYDRIEQN
jgi:hypothetical protein